MLACGSTNSFFIDSVGIVWTAGNNTCGECGVDTSNVDAFIAIPNLPPVVQVCASLGFFTLFLDDEGSVWGCGTNNAGELGIEEALSIVQTPTMISNIPRITMISCGSNHSVLLDHKGYIWGCGANYSGALSTTGTLFPSFIKIATDYIGPLLHVCCAADNTVVMNHLGQLWGTGMNKEGELALGHNDKVERFQRALTPESLQIREFRLGKFHMLVMGDEGCVWSCGDNRLGQLGLGGDKNRNILTCIPNLHPMSFIFCGEYSSFFIDVRKRAYTCGDNSNGILGIKRTRSCNTVTVIPGLPEIILGASGYNHTIVVDTEGCLWGCGVNTHRALGDFLPKSTFSKMDTITVVDNNWHTNEKRYKSTKRAE